MSQLLAALWNEHRSIGAVLHALAFLVDEKRAHGKPLNRDAIRAILYYLDVFPERVHHPKEEQFLFPAVRRRTSEADAVLDTLKQEHLGGEAAIRELEQLLLRYEQGGEAEFSPFADAAERFVKGYREHLRTEEEVVMKVAREALTEGDWIELRAAWSGHTDPLSGFDSHEVNDRMIARIVEMVPPPVGLGGKA
jgi:hemerythrin-like domain-containing protein